MPRVASRIGDLEVSYMIGVQSLAVAEECAIKQCTCSSRADFFILCAAAAGF